MFCYTVATATARETHTPDSWKVAKCSFSSSLSYIQN